MIKQNLSKHGKGIVGELNELLDYCAQQFIVPRHHRIADIIS
jgi:hypothetical protein